MPKSKGNSKQPTTIPARPERDRRVRQHARMARVLSILNLIQSRGRWNSKSIADELECSERTVYRDLEVLEYAGIPWFYCETDQCYRVRSDYHFPVLNLTEDELLGQAVATTISEAPGLDVAGGAKEATRKLAATLDEQGQQLLADCRHVLAVCDLKLADHSRHHGTIETAQLALRAKQRLTGIYFSPYEGSESRLDIHPYRLCLIKRAWYLIGVIVGESQPKTFRIARFKSLRMSGQAAIVPESFSLNQYFGNAWSVYKGEQSYDVRLRFTGTASHVVTETQWHPTQKVSKRRNDSISVEFRVDGLEEIVHWVLTWAGNVIVDEPVELKALLLEKLNQAISMNQLH